MTDRTPTTLDAAWEALHVDLTNAWQNEGPTYYENILARHRPLIETEARAERRAERLDVNALRDAARRSGMPINVTVADIENLVIEYNSGVRYWDGKDAALEEPTE